jgi:hypothetical protein
VMMYSHTQIHFEFHLGRKKSPGKNHPIRFL